MGLLPYYYHSLNTVVDAPSWLLQNDEGIEEIFFSK